MLLIRIAIFKQIWYIYRVIICNDLLILGGGKWKIAKRIEKCKKRRGLL
jgi:hypothetical protein